MSKPAVAAVVAAALAAAGCESPMYQENLALHRQNQELQTRLDESNARLRAAPDTAQYQQLQQALLDRDQRLADAANQPAPATQYVQVVAPGGGTPAGGGGGPGEIGGLETSVDARAGTVTVTLPGDVSFDPGKADLKAAAKASLNKVAADLKRRYPGRSIRVEGHTDSDPITRSKQDWEDNLDLSLGRAAAVSRYLEQQGIDAKRVTTSGYGATHPRSTTKARNRRVEIVVVTR